MSRSITNLMIVKFSSFWALEIVSARLNIFRCNKNFKFVGVAIQVVYIGYIRLKLNGKKKHLSIENWNPIQS